MCIPQGNRGCIIIPRNKRLSIINGYKPCVHFIGHHKQIINSYNGKPSIQFMGHWQKVHNQIKHRRMSHLIRFCTVCLREVKIVSHSSCRTSAILKYFCPLPCSCTYNDFAHFCILCTGDVIFGQYFEKENGKERQQIQNITGTYLSGLFPAILGKGPWP